MLFGVLILNSVKLKESERHDTAEDLSSVKNASRHLDEWAKNRSGLISGTCPSVTFIDLPYICKGRMPLRVDGLFE